jgi:hypothetical protein
MAVNYSPDAVCSKNSGTPRQLSDSLDMLIVEGSSGTATITATGDDLLWANADNRAVTGAWTLLPSGSAKVVAAGARVAVQRATPSGPTPLGVRFD